MATKATPSVPRITVTVARRSAREVREVLNNLVSDLSGKGADRNKLRSIFIAYFVREFFENIHAAFMTKSKGGTDDVGITWEPLAPSTIRRKARKIKKTGHLPSSTTTPGQKRAWSRSYNKALQGFQALGHTKGEAVVKARESAWQSLKRGKAGLPKVPLGIDTHRLEQSLRAGQATQTGTYIPANKDQIYEITKRGAQFGTRVPYAGYFHAKRKIYPGKSHIDPWLVRAAESARNALVKTLEKTL